jgi:hypothetical protein
MPKEIHKLILSFKLKLNTILKKFLSQVLLPQLMNQNLRQVKLEMMVKQLL